MLKESKEYYEKLVDELERLFLQDKWGESDTVQPTIRSVSERHLNAVNTAILEASSQRTQDWVQSQQAQAEKKIHREVGETIAKTSNHYPSSSQKGPVLRQTHEMDEMQQPINFVQQCVGAMTTTNERLTASLAKLSLPKCHSDVFSGDATMFLPWKSAFKGMIGGCDVTPENEMNYLCSSTSGEPQRLVNSCRKRRHKDLRALVKELWEELERRFGNVAAITNAFLLKLKESAKFGENDRKKLQAFSDLCLDVASQVDQLPGLACFNYPNAIPPILYNLPESLRIKWDKQVVEFTSKNRDAYPNFSVFSSMIRRQSLLKNHPNVTAIEKRFKGDRRKPVSHHLTLRIQF